MLKFLMIAFLSVLSPANSINRPVYKVILTQKGYTQFLQYDLETPPLREFTFCTWISISDLDGDQSIFTYVVKGNRIMRLWLDSGGQQIKLSINGKATSTTPVEFAKDVWRHLCLSYQSDYGTWALYVDARLASCEAAQSLYGFVLPGDGSIIVGYGTSDNGTSTGFEGELFGVNMILSSTIERNYTIKRDPMYKQITFPFNKLKTNTRNNKYIAFSDLKREIEKTTTSPFILNKTKFQTPMSFFEHEIGIELNSKHPTKTDLLYEKEISDISFDSGHTKKNNLWNPINKVGKHGKYNIEPNVNKEQFGSGTQDRIKISQYETPPPISLSTFLETTEEMNKITTSQRDFNVNNNLKENISFRSNENIQEPSDRELPPPVKNNPNVYGQWTSSRYAGTVLNYLKSINFKNRELLKKVPSTISLAKSLDAFPYPSDFKRKNVIQSLNLQRRTSRDKNTVIMKRDIRLPQINVQIIKEDLRSNILKMHAETKPENVEITNGGSTSKSNRFYRNADNEKSNEDDSEKTKNKRPLDYLYFTNKVSNKFSKNPDLYKVNNLISILPFLKSIEYFLEDSDSNNSDERVNNNDMYSRSLSDANKWHNVKSYSNDYTPRKVVMSSNNKKSAIDDKVAEVNKKYPTVRIKYKADARKPLSIKEDETILKARDLAVKVSNESKIDKESVSIFQYNHGFLPGHHTKVSDKIKTKTNFNKPIKIGNALNERHYIGTNAEQNKRSFVGGDEKIPDINKYRSDVDNENESVPSSLGPKVCKNLELYDRVFYVQPDGSIDMTHIFSPVKTKNIGVEFILQNYKKCSLIDSTFEKSRLLFIEWTKTPVRLFGGALPKKTTDLCGFF